ncbi:hypothetical protein HX860_05910 [Marine Group I thaumarchaeote]|uniref:Uncharacterized protein n=1 Tax=Marine Group I thaumarchaeote TaxID=2511932 RepID=A0A7K4M948_9ARCH|nr:hypothetical protein [Marine Group I thaumarchaeote]
MKPQFTTTVITDFEGLFERHGLLFKQKLKGEVIISYQVKKGRGDVEISYDFYNIKPL